MSASSMPSADFVTELPVRWSDCDPARVVFYPNYFAYFEQAMVEWLSSRGASWNSLMRDQGLFFPRVEAHARYIAPASFEDRVRVALRVEDVTRKVVTVGWVMQRLRDERTIAEGYVKFAVIQPQLGDEGDPRAIELPAA